MIKSRTEIIYLKIFLNFYMEIRIKERKGRKGGVEKRNEVVSRKFQ